MSLKIAPVVLQAWRTRDKLHAEGDKRIAEGDLVFINAIIKAYGNIEVKWDSNNCTLVTKDGKILLVAFPAYCRG